MADMNRHERRKHKKKATLKLSVDGRALMWEDGREVQAGDLVAGQRYEIDTGPTTLTWPHVPGAAGYCIYERR